MIGPADEAPDSTYTTNVWYVGDCLGKFFDGDPEKITAWWFTPNPQLGFVCPAAMVLAGRDNRLALFVQGAMTDNPPRDADTP